MNTSVKKIVLEAYGVVKMALGIGQIVGLFSGYFLLEWVIRYPAKVFYFVSEDMVALICLIVLLKGIFHLVAGIGIARLQPWGRMWLVWGWPVVFLLTFAVIYSLAQSWIEHGAISHIGDVIVWPHVLGYLLVVGIDYALVAPWIKGLQDEGLSATDSFGMEVKNIFAFLTVFVLFFLVILVFAQPVQKGFHEGYYKMNSGSASKASSGLRSVAIEPSARQEDRSLKEVSLGETQRVALVVEKPVSVKEPVALPAGEPVKKETKGAVPYRSLWGFVGGGFIVVGFLLFASNAQTASILWTCGFLFWAVYGFCLKEAPLSLTSSIVVLICLFHLLKKSE